MKDYEVTFKAKVWYTYYIKAEGPLVAKNLAFRQALAEGCRIKSNTKYTVEEKKND